MATQFSIESARDRFPALKQDQVFLDNAGGSQVLGDVIDSISQYLSHTNVQLGASYNVSRESTLRYSSGCKAAAQYMNADLDEVVLGASTTQLFMNLALALQLNEGDEIVISKIDHETNIDPWTFMAERKKLVVKWWAPEQGSLKLTPDNLKPLLSSKTKFVACTHASNVLGTIHNVREIANTVHGVGAFFSVDAVAYAPHRQIDVKAFGVDFYAFSWYKVYGPHISVLYAKKAVQAHLKPMGHFFNPSESLENKIGFAAANYELTQSIPNIVNYLGGSNPKPVFEAIAAHEEKLQKILLDFLNSRDSITVYGEKSSDPKLRVPTISFSVQGLDSKKVVEDAEKISNFGFRWGHFYSYRLVTEILGLGDTGVIRVSAVHYNTEEEMRGLVEVLKKVLP